MTLTQEQLGSREGIVPRIKKDGLYIKSFVKFLATYSKPP
jgi:hypothetical protein